MVKNGGSLEQKTYEKWETQGHVFCVCYRTLVSAKSTRKYVLTRAWTNTLPRTPSILRTRARTDTLILLHVSTKSSFKSQTSRTGENKTTALMETYVSTNATTVYYHLLESPLLLPPKIHVEIHTVFSEPTIEMHFRAKLVLESILESPESAKLYKYIQG